MSLTLPVFNPSDFRRAGNITVPWHHLAEVAGKAGLAPERLMVLDAPGFPLSFQVDEVDPHDPSRLTLAFRLDRELPEGDNDYSAPSDHVTLISGGDPPPAPKSLRLEVYGPPGDPHRLTLANEVIEV